MHHIVKTRSQHFVSSPRKTASPLITKHSLLNGRHPPKRRRLGSTAFVISRAVRTSDTETEDDDASGDDDDNAASSKITKVIMPLSSEAGQQTINRSRSNRRRSGVQVGKGKGKEQIDVFGEGARHAEDDSSSPRKRKRSRLINSSDGDSGSWSEVDEGEEEPEFIAESDQHLIDSAPAYALHRLRKAELIRLWKVAGMWTSHEDNETVEDAEEEHEHVDELGKKELVDGLIFARTQCSDRLISPLPSSPSRTSPRRRPTIESRRSTSSSQQHSPASSTSEEIPRSHIGEARNVDMTPKAIPRTRSRVRLADTTTLLRTAPRRTKDRRKSGGRSGFRIRSKSIGEEKGDRKARFGDDIKSPAQALNNRRSRRSSTLSSAYTTTDRSTSDHPPRRQTPRRIRRQAGPRGFTPVKRAQAARSGKSPYSRAQNDYDELYENSDGNLSDRLEATPLVQRLRPRRQRDSFVREQSSEIDADDEENGDGAGACATEAEEDGENASPEPSKHSRAKNRSIDSDVSMASSLPIARTLPSRSAKRKAIKALQGGESDTTGMDIDVDMVDDDDDNETEVDAENDDQPPSGPLTRSQLRNQASPPSTPPRRLTRRTSHDFHLSDNEAELSPSADEDEATASPDGDVDVTPAPVHTTRSGKAFGVMQSRRKRLRQEAIDDPDMEVEDDEEAEEDEDDEDETDDEIFDAGIDLSNATIASLTRMLRDELVQMCEVRGIEVGGTKPQLAKALVEWRDEQRVSDSYSNPSSQATARPSSSRKSSSSKFKSRSQSKRIIHAVGSAVLHPGKPTPVLLRDHIHATDPATPAHSNESRPIGSEAELNLDLSELGLEDSMIKPQQLVKLEKIGSGGFKDVFVGKLRGRKVAISEFRGHLSDMDIRELKLLAEFSHPNIVKFRGICIPDDSTLVPCMLVSELCENGDLFDYIRNVPCPTLKRLLGLMLDIAKGLEYLHTRKPSIIHRDCKSSNILINRHGQAKVGDFGLARVKNSTRSMIRSLVGTVNWQAPELWHPSPRYDYKVDVFSAAMVFWEMMSGWTGEKKYPWEGHNEHYIYDAVGAKHRRPSLAGLRKHWGDEPVNLMERMWHQDPAERPTMTDVVADLESLIAEC